MLASLVGSVGDQRPGLHAALPPAIGTRSACCRSYRTCSSFATPTWSTRQVRPSSYSSVRSSPMPFPSPTPAGTPSQRRCHSVAGRQQSSRRLLPSPAPPVPCPATHADSLKHYSSPSCSSSSTKVRARASCWPPRPTPPCGSVEAVHRPGSRPCRPSPPFRPSTDCFPSPTGLHRSLVSVEWRDSPWAKRDGVSEQATGYVGSKRRQRGVVWPAWVSVGLRRSRDIVRANAYAADVWMCWRCWGRREGNGPVVIVWMRDAWL